MMQPKSQPPQCRLSLLLPAYNEGREIFENALKAALQIEQFADTYEVIVVSDGSTDDTVS